MIFNYDGQANKPVIYMIYNTHSHGVYIGQGSECKRRWMRGYAQTLLRGKCHNRHLQSDFLNCSNLLGHTDFLEFFVLKTMVGSTQPEREKTEGEFIRFFKRIGYRVYNNIDDPFSPVHTEQTKQKISETKKNFYQTAKGKTLIEKLAADRTGKTYEEQYGAEKALEIKQKIRDNKLVEMNRPEVKDNLRQQLKGKTNVERYGQAKATEVKAKQSIARKGKYTGADSSRFKMVDGICLQSPDGTVYTSIEGIKEFAELHGLSRNHLSELLSGKRKTHHGWQLVIVKG